MGAANLKQQEESKKGFYNLAINLPNSSNAKFILLKIGQKQPTGSVSIDIDGNVSIWFLTKKIY